MMEGFIRKEGNRLDIKSNGMDGFAIESASMIGIDEICINIYSSNETERSDSDCDYCPSQRVVRDQCSVCSKFIRLCEECSSNGCKHCKQSPLRVLAKKLPTGLRSISIVFRDTSRINTIGFFDIMDAIGSLKPAPSVLIGPANRVIWFHIGYFSRVIAICNSSNGIESWMPKTAVSHRNLCDIGYITEDQVKGDVFGLHNVQDDMITRPRDEITIARAIVAAKPIPTRLYIPDYAYLIRCNQNMLRNFFNICTLLKLFQRHKLSHWRHVNSDAFNLIISFLRPEDWTVRTLKTSKWATGVIAEYRNYQRFLRNRNAVHEKMADIPKRRERLLSEIEELPQEMGRLAKRYKELCDLAPEKKSAYENIREIAQKKMRFI